MTPLPLVAAQRRLAFRRARLLAGPALVVFLIIVAFGGWLAWSGVAPRPQPITPLEAAALPFVGLDEQALLAELGPPGFRRIEQPGEYWRYRSGACALDLFLYPSGGTGPEVRYARYRPNDPDTRPQACAALVAGRAPVPRPETR